MSENNHPSAEQERFIREFIELYKENRILWDKTHPNHKKRDERISALEPILLKCREYHSEADMDFVVNKINTLRTCFRKQYRIVLESRKKSKNPNDVHRPSLWYYNLLLFTVGEKPEENSEHKGVKFFQKVSGWTREYTVILIDLFKKYPVLHPSTVYNKSKKQAAIQKITEELMTLTGKKFRYQDVKNKLMTLKGQYRKQYLQLHMPKSKRVSQKLWCYDLMDGFLRKHINLSQAKEKNHIVNIPTQDSESDLDNDQINDDFKPENGFPYEDDLAPDPAQNNYSSDCYGDYDDIFDVIGKNVAHKLRDMSKEQSGYSEKIINELLYHGMMENLTYNSKLNI